MSNLKLDPEVTVLGTEELTLRVMFLEQMVDHLMEIIAMGGTLDQLNALHLSEQGWVKAIEDCGIG